MLTVHPMFVKYTIQCQKINYVSGADDSNGAHDRFGNVNVFDSSSENNSNGADSEGAQKSPGIILVITFLSFVPQM